MQHPGDLPCRRGVVPRGGGLESSSQKLDFRADLIQRSRELRPSERGLQGNDGFDPSSYLVDQSDPMLPQNPAVIVLGPGMQTGAGHVLQRDGFELEDGLFECDGMTNRRNVESRVSVPAFVYLVFLPEQNGGCARERQDEGRHDQIEIETDCPVGLQHQRVSAASIVLNWGRPDMTCRSRSKSSGAAGRNPVAPMRRRMSLASSPKIERLRNASRKRIV